MSKISIQYKNAYKKNNSVFLSVHFEDYFTYFFD